MSTKLLVDAMKEHPPKVFISASAVGYYGNTHDEEVDEAHSSGTGFLADVCRKWEHEALQANTRVVILRMGVVLTKKGGALKKMLTPFKLGLGAVLGTGNQWMSWIGMPDLLEIFHFALKNDSLSGPVNATSPYPVTNEAFSKEIAKSLGRPCLFRAPEWFLRLVLGEMAEDALLSSTKALPKKLLQSGFEFFQNSPR